MSLLLALAGGGSQVSYTLACASGSYALAGYPASLTRSVKLVCASGTYLLTGNSAKLTRGFKVLCSSGNYVFAGNAAQLTRSVHMPAASGSYVLTGIAATLVYKAGVVKYNLICNTGIYQYVGYSSKGRLDFDMIIGPDTNAIAAAVVASLQVASPPIPVNMVQMNSNVVTGTGQESDKWRAVGVPN